MTRAELEALATDYCLKINRQCPACSEETVWPMDRDTFIAGFLAGRDASAEIIQPKPSYEYKSFYEFMTFLKSVIKKLGEKAEGDV